jgi:hypothetical protein
MGYSIGIHARSKALQQRMLEFMDKEYRPHWQIRELSKVKGLENYQDCFASEPMADSSYFHGKNVIGIDFNAHGFERGYAFILVKWVALQVGTTRWVFKDPKISFKDPVPFMSYDGDENWPVLLQPLSSVPKHVRWCCVDRYGMKLDKTRYEEFVMDWILDPEGKFWAATHEEACRKHAVPNDPLAPVDNRVRQKIINTRMTLLWPHIKEVVAPIRTEMKRLDRAWAKSNACPG